MKKIKIEGFMLAVAMFASFAVGYHSAMEESLITGLVALVGLMIFVPMIAEA